MFLGLDLGTTNVKALAVEADGRVVADGAAAVGRSCTPDGGVEQDIEQIWRATCAGHPPGRRQARRDGDPGGRRVQPGRRHAIARRRRPPAGPVISWLDGRGRPWDERLTEELGEEFLAEHLGRRRCGDDARPDPATAAESPELVRPVRHVAFVGDVIVGRLCGRRAHDPTSLSIAML